MAGCRLPSSGPQAAPGNALRRPGGPSITARTSYVLELVPSTAARNRMPARAMRFIACPSGSCETCASWSSTTRQVICLFRDWADSSYQFCVEGYFGVENLGNRAVLLGFAGNPGEGSFVQVRHFGAQGQRRPADAEALALRLEGDRGLGAELRRRIASALQPKGQGHGEAPSMGGSDQLFGIGAPLVLEARPERVRGLRQHAGIGGKMTAAGAAGPAPNCFRLADHLSLRCKASLFVTASSHTGCFNTVVSTGRFRKRLPVAAKIALATAGTMAEVPASPIPPGGSELWTRWTSMAGASSMRSIW